MRRRFSGVLLANQLPYLTGQQDKSARKEFFYFNDDGQFDIMEQLKKPTGG